MAAILNAYKWASAIFTIQKHSHEAWVVLGAVRGEFEKFAGTIEKAQKMQEPNSSWNLAGTRTVPLSVSCGKWNAYSRGTAKVIRQYRTKVVRRSLWYYYPTQNAAHSYQQEQAAFLREDRFIFF